jgi:hypothetical protein
MIVPILAAGAAIAAYLYSKRTHTVAPDAPAAPPPAGYAASPPAAASYAYPPATTQTNPKDIPADVIRYQAAQPVPSGVYYYPAPGDLWPIVSGRLQGATATMLTSAAPGDRAALQQFLYETDKAGKAGAVLLANLGKLNGFVSFGDYNAWMKSGKPLHLPAGMYVDHSGPVKGAMGTIK